MTRQAPSPNRQINAQSIGFIAKEALANSIKTKMMGVTSRGIFIKSAERWIVFLSFEPYRGPLTVNLKGDVSPLKGLTTDVRLLVSPSQITASRHPFEISLENAEPWQAAPAPVSTSLQAERQQRLRMLAHNAFKQKSPAGLSNLIPLFLNSESTHPQANTLKEIHFHYQKADIPALTQILGSMLGLGGGLTPSWDDFSLGLLLALNRWGHAISHTVSIEKLNTALTQTAYTRTTTISANLIECATMGQADERLINALDFVFRGNGNKTKILDGLLTWGNSSGIDAFLGMLIVLAGLHPSPLITSE